MAKARAAAASKRIFDYLIIGGGIVGQTLARVLRQLAPGVRLGLIEPIPFSWTPPTTPRSLPFHPEVFRESRGQHFGGWVDASIEALNASWPLAWEYHNLPIPTWHARAFAQSQWQPQAKYSITRMPTLSRDIELHAARAISIASRHQKIDVTLEYQDHQRTQLQTHKLILSLAPRDLLPLITPWLPTAWLGKMQCSEHAVQSDLLLSDLTVDAAQDRMSFLRSLKQAPQPVQLGIECHGPYSWHQLAESTRQHLVEQGAKPAQSYFILHSLLPVKSLTLPQRPWPNHFADATAAQQQINAVIDYLPQLQQRFTFHTWQQDPGLFHEAALVHADADNNWQNTLISERIWITGSSCLPGLHGAHPTIAALAQSLSCLKASLAMTD